jgi:hypothetical protein
MNGVIALLRNTAARVIAIQEALEVGDAETAHAIARDLESDLDAQALSLEAAA